MKENKEMKEKIISLENQIKLLNLNLGFLPQNYFDRIKDLEKKIATYSGILAWRIPRTEEPGGLKSMESKKVRH